MAQLRQDFDYFADNDAVIIVTGPDSSKDFRDYWQKHQLPFVGLPDPRHKIARLYGQKIKLMQMGRMPTIMVIDKKGQLRYKHYGSTMMDIPPNSEIISLLRHINQELPQNLDQ